MSCACFAATAEHGSCLALPRPAPLRPALPCLVLDRYSATHVSGRSMFCSSVVWKRVSHVTHVTFANSRPVYTRDKGTEKLCCWLLLCRARLG